MSNRPDTFEILLPDVLSAMNITTPLPLVWADRVGALYRKAREIIAIGDDLTDEAVLKRYAEEGFSDGEVMALGSLVEVMRERKTPLIRPIWQASSYAYRYDKVVCRAEIAIFY